MATVTSKLTLTSADLLSQNLNISVSKSITVDNTTGEPVSAADDVKTIYEDILPLLQSTLGVDDSELNKQRYLNFL